MSTLHGKTLFITGASRGIGLAIALRAARDGANVVIAAKSDVPNPKLRGTIHEAAAQVVAAGGQALAVRCDIREEDQVRAAVAATVERFGGLDILVNNASAIWLRGTLDTPMKRFDLMQQVNARGSFLCAQACLPHLLQAANPHILTLAPPPRTLRPEYDLLALLLRRMVVRAGPAHRMQATEADFRDADWVGWRLAEWLPLDGDERQLLLHDDDADQRLQRLVEWIPRFQAA